jgi:hypothetical protein
MRNKDQILLENLYEFILFERKNLEDGKEFIGKTISIHPVIKVGKTHPDYMKWAINVDGLGYVGDVSTLHIKNVKSIIDHNKIDRTIRSDEDGNKAPLIKLYGELIDVNFSMEELRKKLSNGSWESVTYNPHKHPEYVYKRGLPSWWCGDERLGDNRGTPDFVKNRINTMKEVMNRDDFKSIQTLTQKSGNISSFISDEAILKQHPTCNEDYMWIKGLK